MMKDKGIFHITGSTNSIGQDQDGSTLDGYGAYQSRDLILGGPLGSKEQQAEAGEGGQAAPAAGQRQPHQVKHPTSYMETMLHIFKGNVGAGLLAMGDAFRHGGLLLAPPMMLVLGLVSVHAQHLLLDCSEAMQQQGKRAKPPGFASTVGLVFEHGPPRLRPLAPFMRLLVDAFLCITQLGFCCVYIVFISNNIKLICDEYGLRLELSVHMLLVVVPILAASMVRNLKYLAPLSSAANAMMGVGVGLVVWEAAQDLPPVSSRAYLAPWTQLPLFLGTAIYAFEGIGLVLPLKSEMRRPEQFQRPLGVLNVAMVVVGGIFIGVGFLGYLKWGDDVQGSLTLNLQPGTIRGKAAQLLIALAMLCTYPLQLYVPVRVSWPALRRRMLRRLPRAPPAAGELLYRGLLVFLTFALAESIPQLGLFISLVGAVSSTALALLLPPLAQLVLAAGRPGGVPPAMALKDAAIILLGLFIFVTGTFQSISEIAAAFRAPA